MVVCSMTDAIQPTLATSSTLDRFPFLEGVARYHLARHSSHAIAVDNCTVLHLLRALQYLEMHGEAGASASGHSTLSRSAMCTRDCSTTLPGRATEPVLGLLGTKEP